MILLWLLLLTVGMAMGMLDEWKGNELVRSPKIPRSRLIFYEFSHESNHYDVPGSRVYGNRAQQPVPGTWYFSLSLERGSTRMTIYFIHARSKRRV